MIELTTSERDLRRLESAVNLACVLWVLAGAVLWAYPYLSRSAEFTHNDFVYNYAPFREWLNESLRRGALPLWDSYCGLGRFPELWTQLPIDIFTPLQLLLPRLDYVDILSLQVLILLLGSYWLFRRLSFAPPVSLLGVALLFMAPVTAYSLPYYTRGWACAHYLPAFLGLYLYLAKGLNRGLAFTLIVSGLLAIGENAELLMYNLAGLYAGAFLFLAMRRFDFKKLAASWTALIAPVLLYACFYNLVLLAAAISNRPSTAPFHLSVMLRSLVELLRDPFLDEMLFGVGLLMSGAWFRRSSGRGGLFAALGLTSWISFELLCSCRAATSWCVPAVGLGAAVALFLRRKELSLFEAARLLLLSEALLWYFGRPAPGELEEMVLLSHGSAHFQIAAPALATLGLMSGYRRSLASWSWLLILIVFLMRNLGLVVLSHFLGILWLPTRDNYLIDLPVACLGSIGAAYLTRRCFHRWRKNTKPQWALAYAWPILVALPILRLHDASRDMREPLLSERIRRAVSMTAALPRLGAPAPMRVLGYFHGFDRLRNIADVREYESLVTSRFSTYSLAGRLGLPLRSVAGMGGTTGGLTGHYKRLTRPTGDLGALFKGRRSPFEAYYNFIVNAVPPFDCEQLRLLGVEYVEYPEGRYLLSNAAQLNKFYSWMDSESETIQTDLASKIKACRFATVRLGPNKYWKVPSPMPRAFVIEKARAEDLTDDLLFKVRTGNGKIRLGGKEFDWEPAPIHEYASSVIRLTARSRSGGSLVLTDLYDPHWKAAANGTPRPIFPALFLFRGVDVKAGATELAFELPYPRRRPVEAATALGGGLILALLVFLFRTRSRN